jgi:RNA polymerase sigma-70 factor (ECF subfamily)
LLQHLATARALDQLRRRSRSALLAGPSKLDAVASSEIGPLERNQAAELAEQLRMALSKLPEQQSEAYCLRHLNDFSYQQIAEELGITVNAVGVNLNRAAHRLRIALAPVMAKEQLPR